MNHRVVARALRTLGPTVGPGFVAFKTFREIDLKTPTTSGLHGNTWRWGAVAGTVGKFGSYEEYFVDGGKIIILLLSADSSSSRCFSMIGHSSVFE